MKILVVGESCTDTYVYGQCKRLSPEGPVPVFSPRFNTSYPGMAANTFENIKNICEKSDQTILITNKKENQATKTRYIEEKSNQLLLRVDERDDCKKISNEAINKIKTLLVEERFDLLIVSDYNKGFLCNETLISIGKMARLSILDSKRQLCADIIDSYDFIKLNQKEYNNNLNEFAEFSKRMKAIITMGSDGVRFLDEDYAAPKKIETFDVSGAGDVFTATLSYNFCKTKSIIDSIKFAQSCCSKVILRRGTCVYEKNMD